MVLPACLYRGDANESVAALAESPRIAGSTGTICPGGLSAVAGSVSVASFSGLLSVQDKIARQERNNMIFII